MASYHFPAGVHHIDPIFDHDDLTITGDGSGDSFVFANRLQQGLIRGTSMAIGRWSLMHRIDARHATWQAGVVNPYTGATEQTIPEVGDWAWRKPDNRLYRFTDLQDDVYTVDADIDDDRHTIKTAIGAHRVTSIRYNAQTKFWSLACDSTPLNVSDYVLIGDGWTSDNELHGELCRVHSVSGNTILCWPNIVRTYDQSRTLVMTGVFPKVRISGCTLYTPPNTVGTSAAIWAYFCPLVDIHNCAFANMVPPHPTYAHSMPYVAPVSCRNVTIERCKGVDIQINTSIDVQLIDCDVKGIGFEEECANVTLEGIRGLYANRTGPKRGLLIREDTENVSLRNCNLKQCEQFALPAGVSVSNCSLGIANRGRFYLEAGRVNSTTIIGDLFARGQGCELDDIQVMNQLKLEQGSSGTIRRHRSSSFIDASGEWSVDSAR